MGPYRLRRGAGLIYLDGTQEGFLPGQEDPNTKRPEGSLLQERFERVYKRIALAYCELQGSTWGAREEPLDGMDGMEDMTGAIRAKGNFQILPAK